ncbi:ubiquinol-cytochrome C chaperone family protein [Falsiroseomonas sp. HC035]|uniref:ubiquinol-cytochrome C chaperone family protein n=1 Tax=Falsiroseomonas sp. HC035 TaxID=3390999 RepID=UPI003D323128
MGLLGLLGRKPHERAGFDLYTAAVTAARQPGFFEAGVPDTLDGRFDIVSLHVALLIHRLRRDADPDGPKLAQAVFDAMFSDMDINLREMGVGDLVVGKRVKRMWEAFHGRAAAYEAAVDASDRAALAEALTRNIWRGEQPAGGAAAALADHVLAVTEGLAAQPIATLKRGRAAFPLLAPGGLAAA